MKKAQWISSVLAAGVLIMGQISGNAQNSAVKFPELVVPKTKISQVIVSHKDVSTKPYLSFPCLTRINDQEVLITFKRGVSHGADPEADSDLIRFNTVTNTVLDHKTLGNIPGRIFQLTLPVELAKGDVRFYVDLQSKGQDSKNYREGMISAQTSDYGKTLTEWKRVDQIEGIEYGYPFDFIVEGKVVYMLAMSFGYRPGSVWSVAVLKSEDGARSWKRVQNITEALGGGPINESCFTRLGNDFVVVARGYAGQETKIARFDKNFKLQQVADLTGKDFAVRSYIGWPRIFYKEKQLYVLGRIWPLIPDAKGGVQEDKVTETHNKRLGLLRVDPSTLAVNRMVLLDNEEGVLPVKDGYYAAPYWQQTGSELWFNAVTYRSLGANPPDIIRFAFKWDEIK